MSIKLRVGGWAITEGRKYSCLKTVSRCLPVATNTWKRWAGGSRFGAYSLNELYCQETPTPMKASEPQRRASLPISPHPDKEDPPENKIRSLEGQWTREGL